jgi:hypothetical protein
LEGIDCKDLKYCAGGTLDSTFLNKAFLNFLTIFFKSTLSTQHTDYRYPKKKLQYARQQAVVFTKKNLKTKNIFHAAKSKRI